MSPALVIKGGFSFDDGESLGLQTIELLAVVLGDRVQLHQFTIEFESRFQVAQQRLPGKPLAGGVLDGQLPVDLGQQNDSG